MLRLASLAQGCSSTAALLPLLCQSWRLLLLLLLAAVLLLQELQCLLLQFPASLASCQGARGKACAPPACCGALAAAAGWKGTAAATHTEHITARVSRTILQTLHSCKHQYSTHHTRKCCTVTLLQMCNHRT